MDTAKQLARLLETLKLFDVAIVALDSVSSRSPLGHEAAKAVSRLEQDVELAVADWNSDHEENGPTVRRCSQIDHDYTGKCERYTTNEFALCDVCEDRQEQELSNNG